MNTPNKLTILRIILAPLFMYFLILDTFTSRFISLGIFSVAALTDLADGYYARRKGIVTGFGKFMDPLADKVLVSSALIAFVALDYVAPLPVMLIIGREFFITGLRLVAANSGTAIVPGFWAKLKTFIQMSVVGLMLIYINLFKSLEHVGSPLADFLRFDFVLLFNVSLWITAVLTVWTGVTYVRQHFALVRKVLS